MISDGHKGHSQICINLKNRDPDTLNTVISQHIIKAHERENIFIQCMFPLKSALEICDV